MSSGASPPDGAAGPSSTPSASNSAAQPSSGSSQPSKPKLIPTNSVILRDGTTVRVRIEPTLAVQDVVSQLLINLRIKEPATHYALRDEDGELVTNENLRKKIKGKVTLK